MKENSAPKTLQPEPYDLDKCTIKLVILLHPDDANCAIAASTHLNSRLSLTPDRVNGERKSEPPIMFVR